MLARYALFCIGCAFVQLSRLRALRHAPTVLTIAAVLSVLAEMAIGFWMFRWWVALVVAATVTVVVDVAALQLRRSTLLVLGAFACVAGALSLIGIF